MAESYRITSISDKSHSLHVHVRGPLIPITYAHPDFLNDKKKRLSVKKFGYPDDRSLTI